MSDPLHISRDREFLAFLDGPAFASNTSYRYFVRFFHPDRLGQQKLPSILEYAQNIGADRLDVMSKKLKTYEGEYHAKEHVGFSGSVSNEASRAFEVAFERKTNRLRKDVLHKIIHLEKNMEHQLKAIEYFQNFVKELFTIAGEKIVDHAWVDFVEMNKEQLNVFLNGSTHHSFYFPANVKHFSKELNNASKELAIITTYNQRITHDMKLLKEAIQAYIHTKEGFISLYDQTERKTA